MKKTITSTFVKNYLLLILLPCACLMLLLNQIYQRSLIDEYADRTERSLEYATETINNEMRALYLNTAYMAYNRTLVSLINTWYEGKTSSIKLNSRNLVNSFISTSYDMYGNVENILVFFDDGSYYAYRELADPNLPAAIQRTPLFHELIDSPGNIQYLSNADGPAMQSEEHGYVSLAIGLMGNYSAGAEYWNAHIKAMYVVYTTSVFDNISDPISLGSKSEFMIFDESGNAIIASDSSRRGANVGDYAFAQPYFDAKEPVSNAFTADRSQLFSVLFTNNNRWMMLYTTDVKALSQPFATVIGVIYAVMLALVLLFTVFSLRFFGAIVQPIKRLSEKMKKPKEVLRDGDIEPIGYGEVRELEQMFDQMLKEINRLIAMNAQEEIKALQAQINPHFIHNTLNSIKMMAMLSGRNNISSTVKLLMQLLDISFRYEGNYTTIREEILYLQYYVDIMQMRNPHLFTLQISCDERLKDHKILRLMLQPMVENAIMHGLEDRTDDTGVIEVKIDEADGQLSIEVRDNGRGMSEDKIRTLLSGTDASAEETHSSHIGLMNVRRRIYLHYGMGHDLTIVSRLGQYTSVQIRVPAIRDQQEGEQTREDQPL